MESKIFVYILECADGSYYTGITKDLKIRMKQHSRGIGSRYVSGRRPFKLVYYETKTSRSSAMKREREIKRFSRNRKERLVAEFNQNYNPRDLDE